MTSDTHNPYEEQGFDMQSALDEQIILDISQDIYSGL